MCACISHEICNGYKSLGVSSSKLAVQRTVSNDIFILRSRNKPAGRSSRLAQGAKSGDAGQENTGSYHRLCISSASVSSDFTALYKSYFIIIFYYYLYISTFIFFLFVLWLRLSTFLINERDDDNDVRLSVRLLVRLSVSLFPLYLLNRLTFELQFLLV